MKQYAYKTIRPLRYPSEQATAHSIVKALNEQGVLGFKVIKTLETEFILEREIVGNDGEAMCNHCHMPIRIRNPSGYCDHLHYPDYCNICKRGDGST